MQFSAGWREQPKTPSQLDSAAKGLPIVLPKSWPDLEIFYPWLLAHPTQKTHPALNLHSLHFPGVADLGTESCTPCFHPPAPDHATCAGVLQGEGEARPFRSTLLQPCAVQSGMGRTGIALQLQQELPGFGAFRFTALMQH